jgi:hypothetical protein
MATPNLGLKNDWSPNDIISSSAWLTPISNAVDASARADHISTSVAGTGDITFSVAQYDATSLEATGILTGNRNLILPLTAGRFWWVKNSTTGAFTLTVKGASGTGVVVPAGAAMLLLCDGTNFTSPGVSAAVYTVTNLTTDRTYDANTVVVAELADIVGTLLADLKAAGIIR